jgi:hypothetical protein
LACLRVTADADEVRALCRQVVDWDRFVSWWVRYHRTLPAVYRCLRQCAWAELPEEVRDQLTQRFTRNVRRSMANAAALVRLSELLAEHDVPHLAFKGPTLALRLHGHVTSRHAGDLDVLVDTSQIARADAVLQSAGYRLTEPDFELSPRQRSVYQRIFHHLVHESPDRSTTVELHWRLAYNRFLLPLSFDDLLGRSTRQNIGRRSVPTLSDADLALYLFAHGAAHAWFRLFWLHDVVAAMSRTRCDWVEMLSRATDAGLPRPVLQGALLAHHLLHWPIHSDVLEQAMEDSRVVWMFRFVIDRLVTQYDIYSPTVVESVRGRVLYSSLLRSELAHKFSVVSGLSLNPVHDWRMIQLPDSLFPLYHVLRVPLWCLRQLTARETQGR